MAFANFLMGNRVNLDPRVAFWSREDLWPDDSPEHIFVARAVRKFAKSRFGDAWTDDIPASPMIFELPVDYSTYTPIEEIRRATSILGSISSSYNRRPREGMATTLTMGTTFPTTDEWAEAVAEAKIRSDRFWARYIVFYRTAVVLSGACKEGLVKSATRPHDGGEPIARPWHFWNLERSWIRFDTCRVDPTDEFSANAYSEHGHWLFFEKSSFDTFLMGKEELAQPKVLVESDIAAAKKVNARPRGRPPAFDWDEIVAEFNRIAHEEGIPDETSTSSVARRLGDYCLDKWGKSPDEDYLRGKVGVWRSRIRLRTEE